MSGRDRGAGPHSIWRQGSGRDTVGAAVSSARRGRAAALASETTGGRLLRLARLTVPATLALALLVAPLGAVAQQAGKGVPDWPRDVGEPRGQDGGVISGRSRTSSNGWATSRGRISGSSPRFADGQVERLPALMADLVQLKVDAIVAGSNQTVAIAKRATTAIPIIMTTTADPVGAGFVASLARPGGNITGLAIDVTPYIAGQAAWPC